MRNHRARIPAVCLSVVIVIAWPPHVQPAQAATVLRPNLQMAPINQFDAARIQVVNGRRLLRFTTVMINVGQGPYEVRGSRSSTSNPTMTARQVLYNDAGGSNAYAVNARMQWSGDGHNHWHVIGVMSYELYPASGPITTRRGAKLGFCMLDSTPYNLGLPRAPQSPIYRGSACGSQGSLSLRTGVSVGWGDEYPWNFAYQWIDITGVPAGQYILRATADQQGFYHETNDLDNCVYLRITIPAAGNNNLTAQGSGNNCGQSSVAAVSAFTRAPSWNPPRRLIFEAGKYTAVRFNSVGTVLTTKTLVLPRPSGASANRREIPSGQSSNWFYVTNGALAGHWIRDTAAIDLN